ncbi:MAG: Smr/MutS family protein [Oscillospiraceae bacterium]|nr:Smr/MutS family protein [Oscillospiraceae bacterium]
MVEAFQEIDVHGMNKVTAFAAIDAKLKRASGAVYQLKVIHGYHGGTVLRDAIRAHYKNHPKVKRIELGLNPGETDLILRDL